MGKLNIRAAIQIASRTLHKPIGKLSTKEIRAQLANTKNITDNDIEGVRNTLMETVAREDERGRGNLEKLGEKVVDFAPTEDAKNNARALRAKRKEQDQKQGVNNNSEEWRLQVKTQRGGNVKAPERVVDAPQNTNVAIALVRNTGETDTPPVPEDNTAPARQEQAGPSKRHGRFEHLEERENQALQRTQKGLRDGANALKTGTRYPKNSGGDRSTPTRTFDVVPGRDKVFGGVTCPEVKMDGHVFTPVGTVGKGTFGSAVRYASPGQPDVVIKVPARNTNNAQEDETRVKVARDEINTHQALMGPDGKGHPNVLPLLGVVELNGLPCPVTPLATGGSLTSVVKKIDTALEQNVLSPESGHTLKRYLLQQVVKGMDYVHQDRAMIHFDMKSDNVLVQSDGRVMVADFGGTQKGLGKVDGVLTSPAFSPPEYHRKGKSDVKHDVWALGSLTRQVFTGDFSPLPTGQFNVLKKDKQFGDKLLQQLENFGDNTNNRVYRKGDPSDGAGPRIGALGTFHQLVNAQMHPDPAQRPTPGAVLKHEFLNDPVLSSPENPTTGVPALGEMLGLVLQEKRSKQDVTRLGSLDRATRNALSGGGAWGSI